MEHTFSELAGSGEVQRELNLWDKYVSQENPDMFAFLQLATDGGFSEVKDLYTHSRWLSAMVLAIFVLYNVYTVLVQDMSFIHSPAEAVKQLGGDVHKINDAYYFSEWIMQGFTQLIGMDNSIAAVQILGGLELAGLAMYFLSLLYCSLQITCCKGFKRWFAVQLICWDTLPVLSTYSAMKLLNNVVPSVLVARFYDIIAQLSEASEKKRIFPAVLELVWWVVKLVFSFVIGFDTFLMKLRIVAAYAGSSSGLLPCIQFLVQVLGIVQLGPFVRKRLFVFIFGGEDGIMQQEEIELMDTWNSLLARRMYFDLTKMQFFATMLSFSDEDFQSLVLNEDKTKLGL
mmetsp:Transcript_25501/g.71133  ORF Transcript_25501/g.71133 Transcript_25501/m.71133 type:complete len:343 (+) Transcript_25501:121-1149(+)|eukprot:CAMPEP_0117494664 /NCGR_PEP_ID=MMETSP0784-20121206/19730_1 /TAXON_ID=39447 /ORGANISM="" /LENGTH=342 /DNA_ID=CAMNT_0005289555 /DNA_START=73 /DNA_END=1101 /DNA_ORIENTATION=+